MIRRPPRSTLFPYTTLFRSRDNLPRQPDHVRVFIRRLVQLFAPASPIGIEIGHHELIAGFGRFLYRLVRDRKSTRLNSSHVKNLVCRLLLEKKKTKKYTY